MALTNNKQLQAFIIEANFSELFRMCVFVKVCCRYGAPCKRLYDGEKFL